MHRNGKSLNTTAEDIEHILDTHMCMGLIRNARVGIGDKITSHSPIVSDVTDVIWKCAKYDCKLSTRW